MSTATNARLVATRIVLWLLVGAATTVAAYRLVLGLGVTSALSDAVPWGLWKAFNVLACVPMAAGGFIIAGLVHVLHLRRYHAIARAAVLMAFLGYMTAVTGLFFDIGKPWNIWRPILYWNVHSPLFEVAWCIMLYATVMLAEFSPVIGERLGWSGFVRLMRRLMPVLAILAVAISTLHQSTLGTLFTLTAERLHPLWYSPLLNLLFLVSAVGMGLSFLTVLLMLTAWLYRRAVAWEILTALGRAAGWVLGAYLLLRLGDLALRGQLAAAGDGSAAAWLFWLEIGLGAGATVLLLVRPRPGRRVWTVPWGAGLAVAGLVMHRAAVGTFAQIPLGGPVYLPTPAEVLLTLGLMAGLALVFMLAVERLRVWEEPPAAPDHFSPPLVDPVSSLHLAGPWLGGPQRAALAWIVGAVAGLVVMEIQVPLREAPGARPVAAVRTVAIERLERDDGQGHELRLAATGGAPTGAGERVGLLVQGAGAGRYILFDHLGHQERLGGQTSCGRCHHRNRPLEVGTPCSRCHRDMYRTTDTFSHARHVAAYEGRRGCGECHRDPAAAKTRAGSRPCDDCHRPYRGDDALVSVDAAGEPGLAPGYRRAAHGLCLDCHRREDRRREAARPTLGACAACHQPGFEQDPVRRLWPPTEPGELAAPVAVEASRLRAGGAGRGVSP